MRISSSSILTCILIILHFRFISAESDAAAEDIAMWNRQAYISRLGESPIGPTHRHRRDQENEIENSTDRLEDQNDEDDGGDDGVSDDETDEDNEVDDYSDEENGNEENDSDSEVNENLNLLKTTRKSVNRYKEKNGALDKLMSETSDLAKEVGVVFREIAKREAGLEKEMENLKEALNGAVLTLKNTIKEEEEMKSKNMSGTKVKSYEEKSTPGRQRRDFNTMHNPYRACVSIEPQDEWKTEFNTQQQSRELVSNNINNNNNNNQRQEPLISVQEYMPSRQQMQEYRHQQQASSSSSSFQPSTYVAADNSQTTYGDTRKSTQSNYFPSPPQPPGPPPIPRPLPMIPLQQQSRSQPQNQETKKATFSRVVSSSNVNNNLQVPPSPSNDMNEVDLSEVYWLRLDPSRKQPQLHNKLDKMLKQKQDQGKDVLVIPVSHKYQNTDQVKNGFLRAVRVRPTALKHRAFRKLRSLRVLEF